MSILYPKRLIEVDLPIKRISEHARREKSIRHGHISTLHIWWARRPLAACRAVLCAALWPDPADPLCPEQFRKVAKREMTKWAESYLKLLSQNSLPRFVRFQKNSGLLDDNTQLRKALLDFIADFANWDNSARKEYLETSRILTQVSHETLGGIPNTKPMVVDSFAGGGAIPLEALRTGADAFASDLNPVAVILNKVLLEYIPKYGKRLADEVYRWGNWVKEQAESELAEFYPKDLDGAMPIAYIWARTITCEGPGCGAEVPLIKSCSLMRNSSRSVGLIIAPQRQEKRVDISIVDNIKLRDIGEGTVRRGAASCPVCGYTTPVSSVRKQLRQRKGGAIDPRLVCVVNARPGQQGRSYRLPNSSDLKAAQEASRELSRRLNQHGESLSLIPEEATPPNTSHRAVGSTMIYGMERWRDIFTPRQALALTTLLRVTREAGKECAKEHDRGFATAVQTCLALIIDRQANTFTSLSRWTSTRENIEGVFSRQAIPMVWDFAEANPFSNSTGCYDGALKWVVQVCEMNSFIRNQGETAKSCATYHPLPNDSAQVFFTDPPYYDAVPYAELSDFFYVWLKRMIGELHPDLFQEDVTPKAQQAIVWHPNSEEERRGFEKKMVAALAEGRRVLAPHGIGLIVFAHKSTVGWESQLQALIDSQWTVTGSWPIDTERGTRLNAIGTASLASSIHLVCRPRESHDGSTQLMIGDWRDILQELPQRIHEWLPRLAKEGIVGADAIFSCLGPALEIFSRYSSVEKASGEQVSLREYLEYVWAAVSREALNMIFEGADATGFEEDARLSAMWLWTLSTGTNGNGIKPDEPEDEELDGDDAQEKQSTKASGFVLEYDAARKIAQGLGAHLENLTTLVEVKGNIARLLAVSDRADYLFNKKDEKKKAEKPKATAKQLSFADILGKPQQATNPYFEGEKINFASAKTTLDRVHQSMLLFAMGESGYLKRLLVEEGAGIDPKFWQLAQALSALYPSNTAEKRWIDGVMARKKTLGL